MNKELALNLVEQTRLSNAKLHCLKISQLFEKFNKNIDNIEGARA